MRRKFVVVAFFGEEMVTGSVWAETAGAAIVRAYSLLTAFDWWPRPSRLRLKAFLDIQP